MFDSDNEWLPLGSVVRLVGASQSMMIIGRGLAVQTDGHTVFFDYGGCAWPVGLAGDQVAYFNSSGIEEVVSSCLVNETEKSFVAELSSAVSRMSIPRADVSIMRAQEGADA